MCKAYGYCRISTNKQNIERQERNIKAAFPDAIIVKEAFTGTKVEGRKEFTRLLRTVKAGDTIIFDSVSRMSRNAEEGFTLYEKLFADGVELVFLKEPQINTATYKRAMNEAVPLTGTAVDYILQGVNAYLMALAKEQIKLAFDQAQKEVDDLQQRTKEGIETARLHGKQIGLLQGSKLTIKKAAPAKDAIRKHSREFGGKLTDAECMLVAHVSKPTFYKYKREIRAELEAEQSAE